jgi:hypothetical protein
VFTTTAVYGHVNITIYTGASINTTNSCMCRFDLRNTYAAIGIFQFLNTDYLASSTLSIFYR